MSAMRTCALLLAGVLLAALPGCSKKAVVTPQPLFEREVYSRERILMPHFEWDLKSIHFDFDKSDIRAGEAPILSENCGQIATAEADNQKPSITIEGYCDPIGTAEYNLALGMRRAEATKAYLVKLGADAGQLSPISYGEEKLVTQDPAQFELNRRCEFKVAK
jgi:peptidoglycan-associated lipoprotein